MSTCNLPPPPYPHSHGWAIQDPCPGMLQCCDSLFSPFSYYSHLTHCAVCALAASTCLSPHPPTLVPYFHINGPCQPFFLLQLLEDACRHSTAQHAERGTFRLVLLPSSCCVPISLDTSLAYATCSIDAVRPHDHSTHQDVSSECIIHRTVCKGAA